MTLRKRCLLGCIFFAFLTVRSIAQAPNGFHYVRTDQYPASVLYDSFHQQFFVTVPGKNELDVVSASDGSTVAKIYVASPYGLDLSADGTRLYVTSNSSIFDYPSAEGFFVVDTTTLRVVPRLVAAIKTDFDLMHMHTRLLMRVDEWEKNTFNSKRPHQRHRNRDHAAAEKRACRYHRNSDRHGFQRQL
jgi:hypothetical protein